ncbi:hypothetical protein [Bacteroides sp. UBA939]|uniref:hypothetical protein n=1 Tax=Bacteroides sp. UBA939 TaxID=1946092 RepID=UPI0025B923DB|nr:hypothetical protein [Bacteroides sp. UBA939]
MKTKLFLAAVAVAFSFAVTSCGNKKAADAEVAAEATAVEQVQACDSAAAACCKADSTACCDSTKVCCKEKKECDKK